MIAQRKPNNDKGFEDFALVSRVFRDAQTFLTAARSQTPPPATISAGHALRGANAA